MSAQNPLLDQIYSGENRQLQVLAAQGLVPLAPEELIPVQVALTGSPDPEISGNATRALVELDPQIATNYLRESAGDRELWYFATKVRHPTILQAILRRRDTPRPIFVEIASILPPDQQETLVLRQDAILDEPKILLSLEQNPQLTAYVKRRIWEYREHLLPADKLPPKSDAEIAAEADAITQEDIKEAVEELTGEPAAVDEEGTIDLKRLTGDQVRRLPVPMRLKAARGASQEVRGVLVRDKNAQVAVTAVTANPCGDSEIEQYAGNRSVKEDVLMEIAKNRQWMRKYSIMKALVKNPKTYPNLALRFVVRMTIKDLRDLSRDKNVSEAVRQTATRLYHQRRQN